MIFLIVGSLVRKLFIYKMIDTQTAFKNEKIYCGFV